MAGGIYVHIPFCRKACNYCNFYFTTSVRLLNDFVNALLKEAVLQKNFFEGDTIETLYFGGGTPSILPPEALIKITSHILQHYKCSLNEFTIEANPDDINDEKIRALKELQRLGLNRISLGVQSFFDDDLVYLQRNHTSADAEAAIKRLQDAGFTNISIDLIYGIPTLTDKRWQENLEKIESLGINHFSAYSLTVEENTALFQKIKKRKLAKLEDEHSAAQFDMLMDFAEKHGYEHYEISNLAKPGYRALHNSSYWQGKPYLGLGPSAHSFKDNIRKWNVSHLKKYIEQVVEELPNENLEFLSPRDKANELMLTSLRTSDGLDLSHPLIIVFSNYIREKLKEIPRHHYRVQDNKLVLTKEGRHFADSIALQLWIEE
ncbi:MAG: radical SAM family heme chaperone HemW [Chitinophagales bacterium]|nr:radical SAM family heme chaperone HemW [Chitinophagales bacterium]